MNKTNEKYELSPFHSEVQNTLAKLLARENVIVERSPNFKTASFDVKERVLRLPILNGVIKEVYDLFIAHEVGHALYTTLSNFTGFIDRFGPETKDIYNILEDIRIEKLIQIEYPGIALPFKKGYSHLFETNFFGSTNKAKLNSHSFLDRLNLRAKIGSLVNINFTDDEQLIVNEALAIKTHADLLAVADKLLDIIEEEKKQKELDKDNADETEDNDEDGDSDSDNQNSESSTEDQDTEESDGEGAESDDISDDGTTSDSKESESTDEQGNESTNIDLEEAQGTAGSGDHSVYKSETMKTFEDNVAAASSTDEIYDRTAQFNSPSKKYMKQFVKPFKQTLADRDKNVEGYGLVMDPHLTTVRAEAHARFQREYDKFRKSAKVTTNTLKVEYDRMKAAYEYSRSKSSECGSIDVNKLHSYKFNDKIFATITELAQGESHGLMFVVDFSYSMQYILQEIIERTIILTDFCRLCKIPFEVYTFTSKSIGTDSRTSPYTTLNMYNLSMHEILSHKMTKSEYSRGCRDMLAFSHIHFWSAPGLKCCGLSDSEYMGSTPLLPALVVSTELVKNFKESNKLQNVNFMLLSDGDGDGCLGLTNPNINEPDYEDGKTKHFAYGSVCGGKVLKLPVNHTRSFPESVTAQYNNPRALNRKDESIQILLDNMKELTGAKTICFFAAQKFDGRGAMSSKFPIVHGIATGEWMSSEVMSAAKKNQIVSYDNVMGFDKYILVATNGGTWRQRDQAANGFIELPAGSTDAEIATKFAKAAKLKKEKKIFAKEIVGIVCK